jgi:hypothetical protein
MNLPLDELVIRVSPHPANRLLSAVAQAPSHPLPNSQQVPKQILSSLAQFNPGLFVWDCRGSGP